MNDLSGYRIAPIDPTTAPAHELRKIATLRQSFGREWMPDDPPTPLEVIEQLYRTKPESRWSVHFAARDDHDAIVGLASTGYDATEITNRHLRWSELYVHPEHRRRGLGRELLRRLAAAVADQGGDIVLMAQTTDRIPAGDAFASAVGASAGLVSKMNQLVLAEVDRAKVAEWASVRPVGYRLERLDGPTPDRFLPTWIQAAEGMNDAPRGDLAMEDEHLTAEQIREWNEWERALGIERWLILAVHEATGEGAGFTAVTYDPKVEHQIWQQGTAVTRAHRGHGLGLWMKATMLRRILDERPRARVIRTGNANANAQMLAINTTLGFRQAASTTLWQVPAADLVRHSLLSR
jgi:GNAT superfamily N-acetyltransferase